MFRTPYDLAQSLMGTREIAGEEYNVQIVAMLKLNHSWPRNDETPWCSAFVNYVCARSGLPRSKSLLARTWLGIGEPIELDDARVGFDIVILKRGGGDQPGPNNHKAPGHVGFFAGEKDGDLYVLGGNQNDEVNITLYDGKRLLGVRRLPST